MYVLNLLHADSDETYASKGNPKINFLRKKSEMLENRLRKKIRNGTDKLKPFSLESKGLISIGSDKVFSLNL